MNDFCSARTSIKCDLLAYLPSQTSQINIQSLLHVVCYNKTGFKSRADLNKAAKHCDGRIMHLEVNLEKNNTNFTFFEDFQKILQILGP